MNEFYGRMRVENVNLNIGEPTHERIYYCDRIRLTLSQYRDFFY